jgi:hypothetical protein
MKTIHSTALDQLLENPRRLMIAHCILGLAAAFVFLVTTWYISSLPPHLFIGSRHPPGHQYDYFLGAVCHWLLKRQVHSRQSKCRDRLLLRGDRGSHYGGFRLSVFERFSFLGGGASMGNCGGDDAFFSRRGIFLWVHKLARRRVTKFSNLLWSGRAATSSLIVRGNR